MKKMGKLEIILSSYFVNSNAKVNK